MDRATYILRRYSQLGSQAQPTAQDGLRRTRLTPTGLASFPRTPTPTQTQ